MSQLMQHTGARATNWTCCAAILVLLSAVSASAAEPSESPPLSLSAASSVFEQIDAVASLSGDPLRPRLTSEGGLVVWPEKMWISSTNFSSPDAVRYVTMKLSLANTTDRPIRIERTKVALASGDLTLIANDLPPAARIPLRTDGALRQRSQLQTPEEISIPPHQAASIWTVFAPLPLHPVVPEMSLEVTGEAGTVSVDLNELARLKLGLKLETIGPQDCLAVFHVRGHLDAISAADLTAELNRVVAAGTQRAVIYWDSQADPIDPVLMNWLLSSSSVDQRANPFYAAMPKLPAEGSLRELHLARIPADLDELHMESDLNRAHLEPALAAAAALKSLLPSLDYSRVADQLERGHDWVKVAILDNERVDLPPQALPLVLPLVDDEAPAVRLSAVRALGRINDERAVEVASGLLSGSGDLETKKAALNSLVSSRTTGAFQAVRSHLKDGTLPESNWVLEGLATAPHIEFAPWILERTYASDPELRQGALRALNRTGHPQRIERTIQALGDQSSAVRLAAFQVLTTEDDPRARSAAVDFALKAIGEAELGESFSPFAVVISQTRDPRFAPVLFEMLKNRRGDRSQIIALIGTVGDDRIARKLVAEFPQLNGDERRVVLQILSRLAPQSALELAANSLLSDERELAEAAAEVLRDDGSPASVDLLENALSNASQQQAPILAGALAGIATPRARSALIRFRDRCARQGDAANLKIAIANLQLLQTHSAGWTSREVGRYRYQEEAYEQAVRHFQLAVEIDPLLSEAYSFMGNAYLKLLLAQPEKGNADLKEKYLEGAGTSFQQALKLDPYDGQAITGVGIVTAMEGKPEQAVQLVTDAAHRCPDDYIFEYNTACVYGRALEALQKRPPSDRRDRLISDYGRQGIAHLKRSLELGFNQFDLMASDPDLDTLRGLPAFGDLRD